MIDHLKNLKEYVEYDELYKRFLINPSEDFNGFEIFCIKHCQDIEWIINELEAMFELVQEMKKKYE